MLGNLDDIQEFLYKPSPKVLCVQETYLNSSNTNFLRQCVLFRMNRNDAVASSGGVIIIVVQGVA